MQFFNISARQLRSVAFVVVLLLLMAVCAQAQEGGKVRERVIRFKMTCLVEALDMDEPTAEKFFVRYNLLQNAVREAQKALDSTINELEKAVHDKNSARIREMTDLSIKRHAELQEAIAEVFRSVRPLLNDDQYARFLIFEARFQEEVKKRLMEMRERGDGDHSTKKNNRRRKKGRD